MVEILLFITNIVVLGCTVALTISSNKLDKELRELKELNREEDKE
jgi:hypothetical protein